MLRDTSHDVKQILSSMDVRHVESQDLEKRVSELEKWQTRVIATTTLIGCGLGFLSQHLWK